MKKLSLMLVVMIFASSVFAIKNESKKSSFEIDTKESKVYWTGKKVSGEHTGYLSIGSGSVMVEGGNVVGGNINMDLNSIVCTDLTGEWNDKLVGHLKSEDFFSVEKYPNANFEISSIKAADNGNYQVTGNLSMKSITHEISFPANVSLKDGKVDAKGTASIDRTKWDIKYGSGKFFQGLSDKMIKDEFDITFELKTKTVGALTVK